MTNAQTPILDLSEPGPWDGLTLHHLYLEKPSPEMNEWNASEIISEFNRALEKEVINKYGDNVQYIESRVGPRIKPTNSYLWARLLFVVTSES